VAGIDDLDADRAVVQILLALPARHPRMEGALLLRNETPDRAVLLDDVVRADLCLGVAQAIDCLSRALHPGVVQNQHVDRADVRRFPAAAMVRRKALAYIGEGHTAEKSPKSGRGLRRGG
jgi:uncharacterized protein (DUF2236 family)